MKVSKLSGNRVRVVINGLHAKSGGGVTYLRNLLPWLAQDSRLEIHLFLHRDQYDLFGEPPEGIRLHLLQFRHGFLRLLAWEQMALPYLARAMRADVTFSPANYGPLLAPAPVIVLRNSLAVVQREYRFRKQLYWAGLAVATIASLLCSRRAIAVSDYARRTLSFGLPGLFAGKVEVIHHGVDPRFVQRSAQTGRDPATLLAVSDIYVQKNLHTLIKALAHICETRPETRLLIAGRVVDAGYHAELVRLVSELRLDDSVTFLGGVDPDSLVQLYRRCTVFVFPSTVETFGNPLVEAMACGAPVACSITAAMPEIVGAAAEYFDPLDVAGIAEMVGELLDCPKRRAELSGAGLKQSAHYSWKKTAERTANLLFAAVRSD